MKPLAILLVLSLLGVVAWAFASRGEFPPPAPVDGTPRARPRDGAASDAAIGARTVRADEVEVAPRTTAAPPPQDGADAPTPATSRSVAIRVELFDGSPVEDATVQVVRATGPIALRPTGVDGIVEHRCEDEDLVADRVAIRASVGHLRSALVESRLSSLGTAPLVIRMPPSGEVELALRIAPGAVPEAIEATAAWLQRIVDGKLGEQHGMRIDADRVAHSGPVPLGAQFIASIGTPPMEQRLDGPVTAGQIVRIEFELGAGQIVIAGRMVASDGRPLRSALLRLWSGRGVGILGVRGNAQGDFVRTIEHAEAGAELDVTIESGGRDGRPAESATVHVRALAIGRNELGTIRLAPAAPIATGRVLEADGSPAASAMVLVVQRFDNPGFEPIWIHTMIGGGARADGTFTIDGTPPKGHLGLFASRTLGPGMLVVPAAADVVPIEPPARDVVLTLPPNASDRR